MTVRNVGGRCTDAPAPEGQPDVYDQAPRRNRLPVADEQEQHSYRTNPPPTNKQSAPEKRKSEARTEASARDQSAVADRPGAGLGTESGAPGHAAEDSQAELTQAEETLDGASAAQSFHGRGGPPARSRGSPLPADMDATFQQRWKEIQTRFVDEPRGAVEDADGSGGEPHEQLAEGFAKERERLEAQWGRGEDTSTEDLRVALQRYRSFFQRLLST